MYFRKCGIVMDKSKDEFYDKIDKAKSIYNKAGYTVETIVCDRELRSLINKINDNMNVIINIIINVCSSHFIL